jgi:phosphoglycolate phosphatase (TIGR01487 family)
LINEQKIKAIALDVDGTITDKTRRICLNAVKVIFKAENNGIPVIIVTGNILCATKMISIMLGTTGGLVAENGGVIECQGEKRVLGNIDECQRAYEYLKTKYKVNKVEFSDRESEVAIRREIEEQVVKEALKEFNVEIYDTKFAIHLTDPLVDKGYSLKILAKSRGWQTSEIMAVGDSENDISFLKVAGVKVAVNNADDQLKKIADYVTRKSYGDGVAEAVNKFIFKMD